MKVAVIGGGNSALEAMGDMVKIAEHVYLVSLTPLTGDQILINKAKDASNLSIFLEHKVIEIEGSGQVEGITIRDLKTSEEKKLEVADYVIRNEGDLDQLRKTTIDVHNGILKRFELP